MRIFFKKFLITVLSLFAFISAGAQEYSLSVSAPTVVAVDEVFRVVFTASGKVKTYNFPTFSDFQILAGPSSSTMSSTTFINGKREQTFEESYTFVLQPKAEGKFTIPAASVEIKGKNYTSRPFTIEVVKQQNTAGQTSGTTSSSSASSSTKGSQNLGDKDIMLKLHLSKSSVVRGEPIVATLKLYTRVGVGGFEDVKFPTFNGFWSQEIDTPTNIEFARETIDGEIYDAALIRRYMLIPQQAGNLTIEPAELVCLVQVRTSSPSRSIFDSFFDSGYETLRKRLQTPKLGVKVAQLPAGAPASFTGGVGDFKIEAKLSRESLKAHEAASLVVTISGTGNINLIDAPSLTLPPDFESYDIKRSEKISVGASGNSGTKIFEYPFIPRSSGNFEIAPIEFTYYNLSQGRYVTVSTAPLRLEVERGDETGAVVAPSGTNKQIVKSLGEDVRFISTDSSNLKVNKNPLILSIWFYSGVGAIILICILLCIILDKTIERKRDIVGTKNRKAKKMAKARLKKADLFLKQNLYSAFYEELHKAIQGYISDKLIIPQADLNRENISHALMEKKISEEVIKQLFDLLEACEYARYAPATGHTAMESHYNDAVKVISSIES